MNDSINGVNNQKWRMKNGERRMDNAGRRHGGISGVVRYINSKLVRHTCDSNMHARHEYLLYLRQRGQSRTSPIDVKPLGTE